VGPSPIHAFYHNQEQINGRNNNMFAAMSNVGGWVMGYFDGSPLKLWQWAKEYTLADNFFMGAFGGSFLNHQYLVCACAPRFAEAPPKMRAALDPDGKLVLWSSTQTPHYVHRALAKALAMPAAHIRVVATPNGGGFGGKSDPFNHEIVVAKAALLLDRPVKICLTREEVFYCHRGRHPVLMQFKTGVRSVSPVTARMSSGSMPSTSATHATSTSSDP